MRASRRRRGGGAPGRAHGSAKGSATVGRYRGNPASVGGAPGGAGPYVTGVAPPGKASQTLPVRRGGTVRPATGCLASIPKGSRKPLAPPGAPSPRFGGGRKKGKGVPGALRKNPSQGPAQRWLFIPKAQTVTVILRRPRAARASKDGREYGACGHPSRLASLAPQDDE
jgi:hypothetical protein